MTELPKRPLPHDPPREPRAPHAQPTVFVYEKQQWEYRVLSKSIGDDPQLAGDELNRLGKDGWELVGVVAVSDTLHYYLKRVRS